MQGSEFVAQWIKCGTIFNIGKDRLLIAWGPRTWGKEPLSGCFPSFYFPDYFFKSPNSWFNQPYHLELSIQELQKHLSIFLDTPKRNYAWSNPYKQLFYQAFDEIQEKIAARQLVKAVPFIIESTETAMDQRQLVKSLKQILSYIQGNSAHLYGFWNEEEGILGASPEILFHYDGQGYLKTMACAGTRKVQNDNQELLSSPKEQYEHELVVKGIKEALTPYGKVIVGDRHLLAFSKLAHLVTPIQIELAKEFTFLDIVKTIHPTPAVGTFPKKEGYFWLEEYQQKIDRKRFGAPAGYWFSDSKPSNCYVSIRNVQWNANLMQIAAGCGVVAESECDQEWDEINLKLKAVKEMLAL